MAKVNFTAARIARFTCPPGKGQAFLWDEYARGLALRTTPTGKPVFVFQSQFQGKTLRMTIGTPDTWEIPKAQRKARQLQSLIDEGRDPRVVQSEVTAADSAKHAAEKYAKRTVGEAWSAYIEERRSHWGDFHYRDHIRLGKQGGETALRGTRGRGVTIAGPLYSLMGLRLRDLDAHKIEEWARKNAITRPTTARLAWRLLKTFLTWCSEHQDYRVLMPMTNPAKTKKSREALGAPAAKQDVLQREQLEPWFNAVLRIPNQAIAAYLQALLLMGSRPGELLSIKWADINWQWKSISIHDKVERERQVPLTPYVARLLSALPRRQGNPWLFSSVRSASGRLTEPRLMHGRACEVAGVDGLTLHGLRRSFKSLTEWLEIPAGVVAQLMGHKPSATAEKHYTVRPLELLAGHHERIEKWILEQAGIKFDLKPGRNMRPASASST